MRNIIIVTLGFLLGISALAVGTNDASDTLQKGLFEEEANHNYPAALKAYRTVIEKFDKDRKLAATAVFRVAEIYRKEGKTNEAADQYERIVQEFQDQAQLMTPSQKALATIRPAAAGSSDVSDLELAALKSLKPEDLRAVMTNNYPDTLLKSLVQSLHEAEKARAENLSRYTPQHPSNIRASEQIADLNQKIDMRIRGIMVGMESRRKGVASHPSTSGSSEVPDLELAALKRLNAEELRIVISHNYPDEMLTSLIQHLHEAEQKEVQLSTDFGPENPERVKVKAVISDLNEKINLRIRGIMLGLELRRNNEAHNIASNTGPTNSPDLNASTAEAETLTRLRKLLEESPDLVNATDTSSGRKPLHQAVVDGQLGVADFLLAHGASVDAHDRNGSAPIHLAAARNRKDMVDLLLRNHANVDDADTQGSTALHVAANAGFKAMVEFLLEHKAAINAKARNGATPLHLAVANNFNVLAELLLSQGADPDIMAALVSNNYSGTPLHIAAALGNQPTIELLLARHARVNVFYNGKTPLHLAVEAGNFAAAQLLIVKGADVDAQEKSGITPLQSAVANVRPELVSLLLESKANPDQIGLAQPRSGVGNANITPLQMAVQRNDANLVQILLEHGANPNVEAPDHTILPPLISAVLSRNEKIVDLLIKFKASTEIMAGGSRTSLWLASVEQTPEILKLLLAAKANPNQPDERSDTPLCRAVSAHQIENVKLLLGAGADPNLTNAAGNTPLHLAIESTDKEATELLLAKGANVNAINNEGQSPLTLMKRKNVTAVTSTGLRAPTPVGGAIPMNIKDDFLGLLRQYGAVEDVPRFDRIEVRRPSASYINTLFTKPTNDWNQFTLIEALAVQYGVLTGFADNAQRTRSGLEAGVGVSLPYPDMTHIHIRRPSTNGTNWQEQLVDVGASFNLQDCSPNPVLTWGDVIEVPERDHPLNAPWRSLITEFEPYLKCLTREIEIIVKGTSTKLTLAPDIKTNAVTGVVTFVDQTSFWIRPVLRNSNLLLASSDLARVKVTRMDPITKKKQEWIVDCSPSQPAPPFWLRSGDIIEVPERQ